MALVEKYNTRTVGYTPIDEDHAEFISFLNQLDVASNADFTDLFRQLYEHTEQHFDRENQLMERFGFPAEIEHKSEHQRVLEEFKQFKTTVDKGLILLGRAFISERLSQWFELHLITMDNALAAHLRTQ